jgi:hypothetical protein
MEIPSPGISRRAREPHRLILTLERRRIVLRVGMCIKITTGCCIRLMGGRAILSIGVSEHFEDAVAVEHWMWTWSSCRSGFQSVEVGFGCQRVSWE